ncbi:hypothetical protein [Virgibacillus sediminis]|uniref:Spo0E family sporulation regulatory protein-aspartic acid phosphatase n=1 Tax=Virgibacillus sediminis TaxID=202260 RepID=A0ABV7A6V8_9BACI
MVSREPDISSKMGHDLKNGLLKLSHEIHQVIQTAEASEYSTLHELEDIHQLLHDFQATTAII